VIRRIGLALALMAAGCAERPAARPPAPPPPVQAVPILRPIERVEPREFAFQGALTQGGIAIGQAPPGARAVFLDGESVPISPDGRFLIGFGRNAKPTAIVEALLPDGVRARQTINIAPRVWRVESIPQLHRAPPGAPIDPAAAARRAAEVERIHAARAHASDLMNWTERFVWPVTGRIAGVYGSQRILGGVPSAPHFGVDIARPAGTPVHAPAGGRIVLASPPRYSLEGNMVFIDHGHGLVSILLHLSRVDVVVGQHVRQGDTIGAVGMTGRATGPHLHWAMSWGEVKVDPQLLVPSRQ